MRVGHGKGGLTSPLSTWERQVAWGPVRHRAGHQRRDGGFSRSLRRKAPSFFDAPARTGPEGLRVQAAVLLTLSRKVLLRDSLLAQTGRPSIGAARFYLY